MCVCGGGGEWGGGVRHRKHRSIPLEFKAGQRRAAPCCISLPPLPPIDRFTLQSTMGREEGGGGGWGGGGHDTDQDRWKDVTSGGGGVGVSVSVRVGWQRRLGVGWCQTRLARMRGEHGLRQPSVGIVFATLKSDDEIVCGTGPRERGSVIERRTVFMPLGHKIPLTGRSEASHLF